MCSNEFSALWRSEEKGVPGGAYAKKARAAAAKAPKEAMLTAAPLLAGAPDGEGLEEAADEAAEEAALLADDAWEAALEVRLLIALEALPMTEETEPVTFPGTTEGRGAGVTEGATGFKSAYSVQVEEDGRLHTTASNASDTRAC